VQRPATKRVIRGARDHPHPEAADDPDVHAEGHVSSFPDGVSQPTVLTRLLLHSAGPPGPV